MPRQDHLIRITRDDRAVAGVEFALILPTLLLMFIGTFEISRAIAARGKVAAMTSAIADLVSSKTEIGSSDISTIVSNVTAMLEPYPSTNTTLIKIESIVKKTGATTYNVDWSYTKNAQNPTGKIVTSDVTYTGATPPAENNIKVTVQYAFAPLLQTAYASFITNGSINLNDAIYSARTNKLVTYN